jgi:hypothetical protein
LIDFGVIHAPKKLWSVSQHLIHRLLPRDLPAQTAQ